MKLIYLLGGQHDVCGLGNSGGTQLVPIIPLIEAITFTLLTM